MATDTFAGVSPGSFIAEMVNNNDRQNMALLEEKADQLATEMRAELVGLALDDNAQQPSG